MGAIYSFDRQLRANMPHSKKESKLDRKDHANQVVGEVCMSSKSSILSAMYYVA